MVLSPSIQDCTGFPQVFTDFLSNSGMAFVPRKTPSRYSRENREVHFQPFTSTVQPNSSFTFPVWMPVTVSYSFWLISPMPPPAISITVSS